MQGKKEFSQRIYYNINLDSLVSENHFLKRLQKLNSFDFVRDITKSYYSHTGKPSIDPVVLAKMLDIEEINSRLSKKFTDIAQIVNDILKNFVKKLVIETP